jgi:hypothetical protein
VGTVKRPRHARQSTVFVLVAVALSFASSIAIGSGAGEHAAGAHAAASTVRAANDAVALPAASAVHDRTASDNAPVHRLVLVAVLVALFPLAGVRYGRRTANAGAAHRTQSPRYRRSGRAPPLRQLLTV